MVSICIPVFEQDAGELVRELHRQAGLVDVPVQIIVIDDHSSSVFAERLKDLSGWAQVISLDANIGRARIRNRFLEYAQGTHLLFLDGDSVIIRKDFLSTYLNSIREQDVDVICGGRIYDEAAPDKDHHLHWAYGRAVESRSAAERVKDPYGSFMTHNFLIRKTLLEETRFNEKIEGYGHEDTLFGLLLQQRQATILHIDNPVLHGELADNTGFLKKTEEAIRNLLFIEKSGIGGPGFSNTVKLLRTRDDLKKRGLGLPVRWLYRLARPMMLPLLRSGRMGVSALQFHKLGYLLEQR